MSLALIFAIPGVTGYVAHLASGSGVATIAAIAAMMTLLGGIFLRLRFLVTVFLIGVVGWFLCAPGVFMADPGASLLEPSQGGVMPTVNGLLQLLMLLLAHAITAVMVFSAAYALKAIIARMTLKARA
ncbi:MULTISPECIES: hypothetical protein [Achromobacter]|uniref:Putative membrane protein 92 n=1 Tax=Achromobacter xylosoxidans (strain A8) TaxID=762376 RepID=E3HY95_ACHXA|nr:hypothetical protein [Achromobacter xylosoxidans]ADP20049.1 putative membrane protein 92 [Achromobacter xylosoxidans A8]